MIDTKKVAMMTRIAVYEQGEGRKDKNIHRYSKRVYLGIRRMISFVAVTIAYILAAGLYCFRYVEDIFAQGFSYDYKPLILRLVCGYVVVLAAALFVMEHAGRERYKRMMANLRKYDYNLYRLEQYLNGKGTNE